MRYYYSEEVKLLLMDGSNQTVEVTYNSDSQPFLLPLLGPRPPFYVNPRYEKYLPVL
ncbi:MULTISPECIES: hypothetical protein [Priestia]|uniref:hypothetical protein n=1 Tax=Priestia TaxID=2800373 RepID=UPI0018A2E6C0|nr:MULTISPECIES: hypothetical protein [Priestia]MDR7242675.1 hypothetical protein [Priestia megaterium]QTL48013.1 hypothetical protein J5Z55_18250 [Priestia aryabhattai]USL40945.1 hypothetical protein LIS78_18070 [Priestia megaterium]